MHDFLEFQNKKKYFDCYQNKCYFLSFEILYEKNLKVIISTKQREILTANRKPEFQ
jgi:hypothetical protein